MPIATITFSDGYRMAIHDAERPIAVEAWLLLEGRNPAFDEARATLKHVALPPSWVPRTYRAGRCDARTAATDAETAQNAYWEGLEANARQTGSGTATDNDNLTHEGIDQGMYQAVPRGDR